MGIFCSNGNFKELILLKCSEKIGGIKKKKLVILNQWKSFKFIIFSKFKEIICYSVAGYTVVLIYTYILSLLVYQEVSEKSVSKLKN